MVGFAPSGGIDTFARVIAQALGDRYGWQIVVENRAGAASNIAARLAADASGFLKKQIDTWGNLIRATGITIE